MTSQSLPFSAACERNKDPILSVLCTAFAGVTGVLEVGSGTGQHAVHFARRLPHVTWQPTDRPEWLAGLRARVAVEGTENLLTPLESTWRARVGCRAASTPSSPRTLFTSCRGRRCRRFFVV